MHARAEPVDLSLESSTGGVRRLSDFRGAVVALFWERRDRTTHNTALKDALRQLAHEPANVGRLVVVAAGNVSEFDYFPARSFVRVAMAGISRALGIEVLLDWRGALAESPFDLAPNQSNLLVLDHEGRPVIRRHGVLDAAQRADVLNDVRQLPAMSRTGPRDVAGA